MSRSASGVGPAAIIAADAPKRPTPTISDVARLSGVSKKTVSRVINRSPLLTGETRARVEAVIADLGYVPNPQARALALGRNFLIGLIHDNPNAQMVLGVQQGILSAIRTTEFALVVRPVDRGSPAMLDDIRAFIETHRLFGVMLLPPISEDDDLARLCGDLGCRYVRMGSGPLDSDDRAVWSNDADAVARAVAHLVEAGHRRIAMVAGPAGFRSAAERHAGFTAAIARAGLPADDTLVVAGDYRFASGRRAGERLLALADPPTAIFAANDEMAAGVVHAAHATGIDVPGALSVIGFDDTPTAAHLWPPLTTVRWPIAAMAHAAAQKLLAAAGDHDNDPPPARFASRLIHRASVARRTN